jgi:hypothetical protein
MLPKFSIYFNGITNIIPDEERDLKALSEAIRGREKLRILTEKLRSIADLKERAEYKKTLPYVTFSGTFKKRSNSDLIQHSGYLCLDLDHLGGSLSIHIKKTQVLNSLTPALMFTSPSGEGLKILYQVDIEQGTHFEYFNSLQRYFKTEFDTEIDPSGKDVSRACFVCHDPDVFYSETPSILDRAFIESYIDNKPPVPVKEPVKIIDGFEIYNKCKVWVDKTERFTEGNRNRYITKLAVALNRYGIPEKFAIIELSRFACNGFPQHEIEATVRSIYRSTQFHGTAKFEDVTSLSSNDSPKNEIADKETLPTTPLLPIEGLPDFLQKLIIECSDVYGTHRDFWAGAILSASSLAIGKNFKINHKYINGAVLWFAIVAPTGSGKTEPLKFAFTPFHRLDSESFKEYERAMNEYETIKNMWKEDRKSKGIIEVPVKPLCKQFILSDSTPEGLYQAHNSNPRGIMVNRDELKGLIDDFGRYSKSGEVANWLSSWSQQPMTFNRKSERPMKISDPFIGLIGGLQPTTLPELAKDNRDSNGFLQRFNYLFPDIANRPYYQDRELPYIFIEKYGKYIENLLKTNKPETEYVMLSSEAKELFKDFDNRITDLINAQKSDSMRGMFAKLPINALRLALVIHFSHLAFDSIARPEIEPGTMQAAINMAEYFKITGEKVFRQLENSSIHLVNNKNVAQFLSTEKNHSQSEIARILGVTHQYINKLLRKS